MVFLVSEEIETKIRKCTAKSSNVPIQFLDVLQWSISETFAEMHRSMPLWSTQGRTYIEQEELWNEYYTDGQTCLSKQKAERFLAPEAQTIEERYHPRVESPDAERRVALSVNRKLRQISERCQQLSGLNFNSSTLQEEQERELSPEIEQERQVQKTAPAQPKEQALAFDVWQFALKGIARAESEAYFPAFMALQDTSGADSFDVTLFAKKHFAGQLMVTADFARTVVRSGNSYRSDQYQRSVQWIISRYDEQSNEADVLMIISPFEANSIILEIAHSTKTALHLYKARCNSGFPSLDALQLYTTTAQNSTQMIPRILATQLDLFAGQLYFSSFEDYRQTCDFLGLTIGATPSGWEVTPDGFIVWDGTTKLGKNENPVHFIKHLMTTIRRNGQGIAKTDMGGLLEGKLFQRSDFEDR